MQRWMPTISPFFNTNIRRQKSPTWRFSCTELRAPRMLKRRLPYVWSQLVHQMLFLVVSPPSFLASEGWLQREQHSMPRRFTSKKKTTDRADAMWNYYKATRLSLCTTAQSSQSLSCPVYTLCIRVILQCGLFLLMYVCKASRLCLENWFTKAGAISFKIQNFILCGSCRRDQEKCVTTHWL